MNMREKTLSLALILALVTSGLVAPSSATEPATPSDPNPRMIIVPGVRFALPEGWIVAEESREKVVLQAGKDATTFVSISSAGCGKRVDDRLFEKLANEHLQKERKAAPKGKVKSVPPYMLQMAYYGGPRSNGRIFAGCLNGVGDRLVIVATEMDGSDPKKAMVMVSDFLQKMEFK